MELIGPQIGCTPRGGDELERHDLAREAAAALRPAGADGWAQRSVHTRRIEAGTKAPRRGERRGKRRTRTHTKRASQPVRF